MAVQIVGHQSIMPFEFGVDWGLSWLIPHKDEAGEDKSKFIKMVITPVVMSEGNFESGQLKMSQVRDDTAGEADSTSLPDLDYTINWDCTV